MKTLCGWAVGLAHVPQSGLPDLIRPARTDTPSAPRASTPTDARTAGPAAAPLAPSTSPGERGGLPRRRVPGPSRAVCALETGRYRPGRTASRHGPSEPRSSPARARGRLRRPASLPRVPRSRTGPSVWPGREQRRTDGRCPAPSAPWPCTASGFLDSGLTVFASTPPRPARGGRVAPGPGFGSRPSPASTARCTSA